MQSVFLLNRRITITFFFVFFITTAFSQQRFSIATDISIQRNFQKEQQYWALGHTIQTLFHLTPKQGIYAWFAYYSNGKFKNKVTATAKTPIVNSEINYINAARMRLKQISVGWRRYLKGTPDAESGWNLYGNAGLGLLLGGVLNTHSVSIDTAFYTVPVLNGHANFKRLTLDLGMGLETPLGGDFYLYADGRVWIPITDYPSRYIFVNNNAPLVGMLGVGIRILF